MKSVLLFLIALMSLKYKKAINQLLQTILLSLKPLFNKLLKNDQSGKPPIAPSITITKTESDAIVTNALPTRGRRDSITAPRPIHHSKPLDRLGSIEEIRLKYNDQLESTKTLVKSVLDPSKWTDVSVNNNVSISKCDSFEGDLPWIRGSANYDSKFTPLEWLSIIRSPFARVKWDPRFDFGSLVQFIDVSTFIGYSVQKGAFAVSPRDFVTIVHTFHPNQRESCYIATSIEHPDAPSDSSKRVRGHLYLMAWCVKEVNGRIEVQYIVGVDVKGNIPNAIIKQVQSQTPMCIERVHNYLVDKGPVPFVVKPKAESKFGVYGDVCDLYEEIVPEDEKYIVTFKYSGNSCRISIYIPKRYYPNGADVTCKGGVGCKGILHDPDNSLFGSDSCRNILQLVFEDGVENIEASDSGYIPQNTNNNNNNDDDDAEDKLGEAVTLVGSLTGLDNSKSVEIEITRIEGINSSLNIGNDIVLNGHPLSVNEESALL